MAKPKPVPLSRSCLRCDALFSTGRQTQVYCSLDCRNTVTRNAWRELNPPSGLATATTGAISELVIAVDLMKSGYSVFRALSPACHCDLAVLRDGKLCRVEVKTAYLSATGKITYPAPLSDRYDVLALVRNDHIEYLPPIEEWFAR